MSWLGNGFREESQALADAYAQMYAPKEEQQKEEKVEQEELSEGDMSKAPSIKNAKPAKKTNVKLYPGLGIAPTVKEETIEEGKKSREERAAERRAEAEYAEKGESMSKSDSIRRAEDRINAPDADEKKTKKLKRREMRKGEGLGVGARKRQGVGKLSPANPDRGGDVQFQSYEYDGEGEQLDEKKGRCWKGYKPTPGKKPYAPGSCQKEEQLLQAMADAYQMMYEKKKSGKDKCGEGTYWDSEEKKCKSKKKSGGGGRAIFYGGHSHSHDDDKDDDGGSDAGAMGDAAGGGGGGE